MEAKMHNLNTVEVAYLTTAFFFQLVLVAHFAVRKWRFSLALRYGWIVYALSLPAAAVSVALVVGHTPWYFWVGGLIYLVWAIYGFWIEYRNEIEWRNPIRWSVLVPYISLYLATVMFYWWPLARIDKSLWVIGAFLFLAGTVLNITSHKRSETIATSA
jgi:hypothetical protein